MDCVDLIKASIQVLTNKVGPYGGSGGSVRDMNVNGITRIVKISVRHGDIIDALTVRFLRNGHEESTEQWGGEGGKLTEVRIFCISILIDYNFVSDKWKALFLGKAN